MVIENCLLYGKVPGLRSALQAHTRPRTFDLRPETLLLLLVPATAG